MPEACKVLLGVCGGIAAYKSAELVRELQRHGAEVRVMMTRSAQEFIQPLTFASLTGHKVFTSLWDSPSEAAVIEHIAQAQWADVLVIAPATANTLAKLAHGIADDFLSASYLATEGEGCSGACHECEHVESSRHTRKHLGAGATRTSDRRAWRRLSCMRDDG